MKGKARCRMHGGKTPKGTRGNRSHGIYSDALTDEETGLWADIVARLGTVDEEIHMVRVQLRRALIAQHKADAAKGRASLEMVEIRESDAGFEGGPRVDVISKRTDFHAIIDRLSGRLANLEKTRAELLAAEREAGADPADKAREVAEALKAMRTLEQRVDGDDA